MRRLVLHILFIPMDGTRRRGRESGGIAMRENESQETTTAWDGNDDGSPSDPILHY